MHSPLIKLALLALLLASTCCLNLISYTFNAGTNNLYAPPSYALGTLNNGSVLSVTIQPNDNSISDYAVVVKDANNAATITTLTLTGSPYSASWTVNSTATYYLQVSGPAPSTAVKMYQLIATTGTTTLLRLTDILRPNVVRYIYVAQDDPAFASASISSTSSVSLAAIKMSSSNQFQAAGVPTSVSSTVANGVTTYNISGLTTGYYVLLFTVPSSYVTITFPTSSYPCPFSSAFTDYYGTFSGCVGPTQSQPGPPCYNYDYTNLKCLSCVSGYTYSNGQCLLPSPCTSRQYYHYGVCYSVNPLCDSFDSYTGDCLSCLNPTQYKLASGQCVASYNTVVCSDGTYAFGSICISNTCSAAFNNGSCTTCISTAFYLSNGACLPINCGTNSYFSVKFNGCVSIPVACANFSVLAQACQICVTAYFLNNGLCVQPYGSANCLTWNFNTNLCDQCLPNYSPVLNICTLNTIAPISCPSGQYLVDKACFNLPPNCLALNSFYFCSQCALNYQVQAGSCVACNGTNPTFPCVSCPSGYFVSLSGSCQLINANCYSYNPQNGQCTSCNLGVNPVNGLCCLDYETVQNGKCVAASPASSGSSNSAAGGIAAQYGKDPNYFDYCQVVTAGVCTLCWNGHTTDFADHCV